MKKNTPITSENVHQLNPGDKLRVVEPNDSENLTRGSVVQFERALSEDLGSEIYVSSPKRLSYLPNRFVFESAAGVVRDSRGRFTSVAVQKTRVKPTVLRKGALYAVKRKRGIQIANLRAVAYGDVLVFSRHKKPFLAKRNQVFLADNNEVKSYLRGADRSK